MCHIADGRLSPLCRCPAAAPVFCFQLEREVAEREELLARTKEELGYFKRELLSRDEDGGGGGGGNGGGNGVPPPGRRAGDPPPPGRVQVIKPKGGSGGPPAAAKTLL